MLHNPWYPIDSWSFNGSSEIFIHISFQKITTFYSKPLRFDPQFVYISCLKLDVTPWHNARHVVGEIFFTYAISFHADHHIRSHSFTHYHVVERVCPRHGRYFSARFIPLMVSSNMSPVDIVCFFSWSHRAPHQHKNEYHIMCQDPIIRSWNVMEFNHKNT